MKGNDNPWRLLDESQEAYRKRRSEQQAKDKKRTSGRLLWDSGKDGTYRRDKHGDLTAALRGEEG